MKINKQDFPSTKLEKTRSPLHPKISDLRQCNTPELTKIWFKYVLSLSMRFDTVHTLKTHFNLFFLKIYQYEILSGTNNLPVGKQQKNQAKSHHTLGTDQDLIN